MTVVSNVKEVYSGLGKVDFSASSIPAYNKEKACVSVSRTVLAALIGLVSLAAFVVGCVSCVTSGLGFVTGIATIALAALGLAWAVVMMIRLFVKRAMKSPEEGGKPSAPTTPTPTRKFKIISVEEKDDGSKGGVRELRLEDALEHSSGESGGFI